MHQTAVATLLPFPHLHTLTDIKFMEAFKRQNLQSESKSVKDHNTGCLVALTVCSVLTPRSTIQYIEYN